MVKVITYGTYDLLHYGHIALLKRAKALGDYLVVGVTADDFDKARGKINVQQSLMERIEALKATGIPDEIIIEEYEGQKIDDIRRLGIDIFTVGSDWVGKFDYLKEYCKVVYLPRTEGVSSSEIRAEKQRVTMGLVGESNVLDKFAGECMQVNGVSVHGVCTKEPDLLPKRLKELPVVTSNYEELLQAVDAVYLVSKPALHYEQIKRALEQGKHVLCETPITLKESQCTELFAMAKAKGLILAEGNKTAYATAYSRLLLLIKTGKIGKVVSVDVTSTSLNDCYYLKDFSYQDAWGSMESWGTVSMLPIFQILGCKYTQKHITSWITDESSKYDRFSKIDFLYPEAVASLKVGKGVKSEGEMIISGTLGYVYVPAPWWKTDYFEIRYENPLDNKRYFYQLEGEGIRYEIVAFIKSIETGRKNLYIDEQISTTITRVMEDYYQEKDLKRL